jgi:hypothetical protein
LKNNVVVLRLPRGFPWLKWTYMSPQAAEKLTPLCAAERMARRLADKKIHGDLAFERLPLCGSLVFFHIDCYDELKRIVEEINHERTV